MNIFLYIAIVLLVISGIGMVVVYRNILKEIRMIKQRQIQDYKDFLEKYGIDEVTLGDCQDVYDRLDVPSTHHNMTSTMLCGIIKKVESSIGHNRFKQILESNE